VLTGGNGGCNEPSSTRNETPTTNYTPQDVHRNLQTLQEKDYVSDRNAELLEEFVHELQAREETSDSRCCWYISKFSTLLKRYINTDKNENLSTDSLDELNRQI
jgi:hypothetical protein